MQGDDAGQRVRRDPGDAVRGAPRGLLGGLRQLDVRQSPVPLQIGPHEAAHAPGRQRERDGGEHQDLPRPSAPLRHGGHGDAVLLEGSAGAAPGEVAGVPRGSGRSPGVVVPPGIGRVGLDGTVGPGRGGKNSGGAVGRRGHGGHRIRRPCGFRFRYEGQGQGVVGCAALGRDGVRGGRPVGRGGRLGPGDGRGDGRGGLCPLLGRARPDTARGVPGDGGVGGIRFREAGRRGVRARVLGPGSTPPVRLRGPALVHALPTPGPRHSAPTATTDWSTPRP